MKLKSALILVMLLGLFACKEDTNPVGNDQMMITDFSPKEGKAGDEVMIFGTGLPTSISSTKVMFGSVEATIKSTSSEDMIVTVPVGAETALITIQFNNFQVKSSTEFTVTGGGNGGGDGTASDFMPEVASWSIFENYEIDENDDRSEMISRDSMYYSGYEMVDGFDALRMYVTSTDADGMTSTDESYIRSTDSEIYIYGGADMMGGGPGEDLGLPIPDLSWIKVMDMENDEWVVFDEEFGMDTEQGTITFTMLAEARKSASSKSITINGSSYEAIEVVMDISIGIALGPISMEQEMEQRMLFVEGLGLVRSYMPWSEGMGGPFGGDAEPIMGSESIMVKHSN